MVAEREDEEQHACALNMSDGISDIRKQVEVTLEWSDTVALLAVAKAGVSSRQVRATW